MITNVHHQPLTFPTTHFLLRYHDFITLDLRVKTLFGWWSAVIMDFAVLIAHRCWDQIIESENNESLCRLKRNAALWGVMRWGGRNPFMKMDGYFQINLNLRAVCEFNYRFYCIVDVYFVRVMVWASIFEHSRFTESCSIIKNSIDIVFKIVTYIREERLIGKENEKESCF